MSGGRQAGHGTNQEAVRRHNLGTLLRHVHRTGQMSRAELTAAMRLNRSTIADLVTELQERGITEQVAPEARPRAGRPSPSVRPAAGAPYAVAVDLGVDRVTTARVGLGGVIQRRQRARLDARSEARQIGSLVAGMVRCVVDDAPERAPLLGVGIGVPGLVRRTDGLVRLAPNLGWHDVSFSSIVLEALQVDLPVRVANDAALGAVAEHNRGAAVDHDDLVYVTGNVGVGAGVITGGTPLGGVGGYAGEVGHLRLGTGNRLCHCGGRGCWETDVGGHAIADAIDCPAADVPRLDEVLGDYATSPELARIGAELGRGLGSIANMLNPELLMLGGYFRTLYPLVQREVDAAFTGHALGAMRESATIVLPGLGGDAVLLGAADLAFEGFLDDPVAGLAVGLADAGSLMVTSSSGSSP